MFEDIGGGFSSKNWGGGKDERGSKQPIKEIVVSKEKDGDTDSIDEAIKICPEGGRIRILEGEYYFKNFDGIKNFTSMEGDGKAKILIDTAGMDGDPIYIFNKEGLEFKNIKFEGTNQTATYINILSFAGSTRGTKNIKIRECSFEYIGIRFLAEEYQQEDIFIENNYFGVKSVVSIETYGEIEKGKNVFISGNLLEDCQIDMTDNGVIIGNTIINDPSENTFGITLQGDRGGVVANHIKAKYGIFLLNGVGTGFIISGNNLTDCTNKISGDSTVGTSRNGPAHFYGNVEATGTITGSNLSGTNTGDQTSMSGISDTMANFDIALSDGSFAYSGGAFHDGFSDYVANEHIDWTASSSNLDTSGTIGASYFISDVAVGTAPYQCTSTTLNTNLNADMVDGCHASSLISPTGAVIQFAGSAAPSGWLICDGSAIDRTTYAALFTAISTTYGAGDGSTTFNIPDLRTRVAVGKNASGTFKNLGATGGVETHTLTTDEMPSHTHTQNSHTHTQNLHSHVQQAYFEGYGVRDMAAESGTTGGAKTFTLAGQGSAVLSTKTTRATNQSTTATNENTGGSGAHTNLQPYIVLNYIIKT